MPAILSPAAIVASGVDWITYTAPPGGQDAKLVVAADGPIQREESLGNQVSRQRWRSYELTACGGVSAGLGMQGGIVRLSGTAAQRYWRQLYSFAFNVSRIDLQCTIRPNPPDDQLGRRHLTQADRWTDGRDRAPRVTFNGARRRVQCVYLGSRSSEAFARIYDKFAESGEDAYRGCWRYEVEAKRTLAGQLARALAHHADHDRAARLYVFDHFERRGVSPRFQRDAGELHAASVRSPTDDERRLRWLAEQVQPVLVGLADRGKRLEALLALGLTGLAAYADSYAAHHAQGGTDHDRICDSDRA